MSEWLGQTNGTFAYNPTAAYQLPANWDAAATGDFNGDGRDDILWRNETGAMSEWLAQPGGTFAWNPNAAYQLPTSWNVAATGSSISGSATPSNCTSGSAGFTHGPSTFMIVRTRSARRTGRHRRP